MAKKTKKSDKTPTAKPRVSKKKESPKSPPRIAPAGFAAPVNLESAILAVLEDAKASSLTSDETARVLAARFFPTARVSDALGSLSQQGKIRSIGGQRFAHADADPTAFVESADHDDSAAIHTAAITNAPGISSGPRVAVRSKLDLERTIFNLLCDPERRPDGAGQISVAEMQRLLLLRTGQDPGFGYTYGALEALVGNRRISGDNGKYSCPCA